jgi:prophage DNA circulation protein
MLNWRSTLNDVEDAGEYAMDQLLSAADSVGKSARDGYKAVVKGAKSDAAFWSAITVGMGACAGGMFALWRFATGNPRGKRLVRDGKRMVRSVTKSIDRNSKSVARAVAAANRDVSKFMRSMPLGMGGMSKPVRKRSRKTTRSRSRRRATM